MIFGIGWQKAQGVLVYFAKVLRRTDGADEVELALQ